MIYFERDKETMRKIRYGKNEGERERISRGL